MRSTSPFAGVSQAPTGYNPLAGNSDIPCLRLVSEAVDDAAILDNQVRPVGCHESGFHESRNVTMRL